MAIISGSLEAGREGHEVRNVPMVNTAYYYGQHRVESLATPVAFDHQDAQKLSDPPFHVEVPPVSCTDLAILG